MKNIFKKIKPIKYVCLLQKYNKLENDYNLLLEAVKNDCFKAVYEKICIPEQLQKKDLTIKRLKKQIKALKEAKN